MKIPQYQPGNVPPAPSTGPTRWALGQAEQGMNRISQGLTDVSNTLNDIAQEKKKISQATQLGESRVNFENEWITQKAEWDKSNPDPDTYYQKGSELYDKVLEKSLRQTKDTGVRDKFKIMMMEHKVTVLDSLGKEANQKWVDTNIASKMNQVDMFADLAGKAADPEYARSYKESARAVIRSMSGNLIHQAQAQVLEKSKMQELDEAGVKNHILIDPVGAAKALEGGDYPDLSPKDRPYYKKEAKTAIKAMENENEDKQVDLMYQKLHRTYGTDYAIIYDRLRDSDYMKQNFGDVPIKVKTKVEQAFAEEKLRVDQVKHDKSEVVFRDTIVNFNGMTSQEIRRRVAQEGLDPGKGMALIRELENPPDVPRNPWAFNDMMKRIDGVESSVELDKVANNILGSNQPRGDKISQLGLLYRDEDKTTQLNRKRGHEIIQGQIGPKTDIFGKALPFSEPEAKNYFKATQTMDEEISAAKKKGKPLTTQEITDRAFEISSANKLSLTEKGKARATELSGKGKGLIEEIKKVPPKKPDESPADYLKRIHGATPGSPM